MKNPLVKCACGCGLMRKKYDENCREHKFILGHGNEGENNPFFGKHHTKTTKGLISKINKGRKCPHTSERNRKNCGENSPTFGLKRLDISERNRNNCGEKSPMFGRTGKKNHNWKGGITSLTRLIRHHFKYRQWRSDVFTRDDFTCVLCGKRGNYLEADHFPKLFSSIFHENNIKTIEHALECEEFWNINNGRTLCRICHNKNKQWRVRYNASNSN